MLTLLSLRQSLIPRPLVAETPVEPVVTTQLRAVSLKVSEERLDDRTEGTAVTAQPPRKPASINKAVNKFKPSAARGRSARPKHCKPPRLRAR